jgi:hypothetical protein
LSPNQIHFALKVLAPAGRVDQLFARWWSHLDGEVAIGSLPKLHNHSFRKEIESLGIGAFLLFLANFAAIAFGAFVTSWLVRQRYTVPPRHSCRDWFSRPYSSSSLFT